MSMMASEDIYQEAPGTLAEKLYADLWQLFPRLNFPELRVSSILQNREKKDPYFAFKQHLNDIEERALSSIEMADGKFYLEVLDFDGVITGARNNALGHEELDMLSRIAAIPNILIVGFSSGGKRLRSIGDAAVKLINPGAQGAQETLAGVGIGSQIGTNRQEKRPDNERLSSEGVFEFILDGLKEKLSSASFDTMNIDLIVDFGHALSIKDADLALLFRNVNFKNEINALINIYRLLSENGYSVESWNLRVVEHNRTLHWLYEKLMKLAGRVVQG